MKSQSDLLDDLFARWKNRYQDPDRARFVRDGIIDQKQWNRVEPGKKIAFLLKEANLGESSSGDNDFREWARKKPWNELGHWAYVVRNTTTQEIPRFEEISQEDRSRYYYWASAVVNLKKIGGGSRADPEQIQHAVDMDWGFIREELDIIQPDIVVCGGTWDFVRARASLIPQSHHTRVGAVLWIKFCHPSAVVDTIIKYYGLAALYQKILQG